MTRCGATIGKDRAEFGFTPRQCGQTIGIQPVLGVDGRMRFACLRWGHREDVVRQFGEMPDPQEPDWLHDGVRAAELRGLAPGITGGLSSEDYVRRIRDDESEQGDPLTAAKGWYDQ